MPCCEDSRNRRRLACSLREAAKAADRHGVGNSPKTNCRVPVQRNMYGGVIEPFIVKKALPTLYAPNLYYYSVAFAKEKDDREAPHLLMYVYEQVALTNQTPHRLCKRSMGCKAKMKGRDAMLQYILYIFYRLLALGSIYMLISRLRIERNGIETEAVVSRINSQESRNDDETVATKDFYYVTYVDQDRQTVEATLLHPSMGLKEGSRLQIKYTPEKPKLAVVTEVIDK